MAGLREAQKELMKVTKNIERVSEKMEHQGTGLCAEKVISATFTIMTIEQLEDVRYLLTQEIKKRKIYKRANETK